MIETTYVAINEAAKALNVSEDNLLVAASEGHIQLHWLLNRRVQAERGYWEENEPTEPGEPDRYWFIQEIAYIHFMYIALTCWEAADILKEGEVIAGSRYSLRLREADDNSYWTPTSWGENDNGGLTQEDLRVSSRILFVLSADLDAIKAQKHTSLTQHSNHRSSGEQEHYKSKKLVDLIEVARLLWSNADRDERDTHPTNMDVVSELKRRGFTESVAAKAATIIRPEWAPRGRKPEI